MTKTDGWRRPVSGALLVAGYGTAGWAAVRLVPVWRERRVGRFLALEAGTALVTIGLVLRRRPLPAAANGAALAGLGLAWVATGRARR
jgi:hypothetical protein